MSGVTASRPSLRRPRALLPGDRIAVVAPASAFDRRAFESGARCTLEWNQVDAMTNRARIEAISCSLPRA